MKDGKREVTQEMNQEMEEEKRGNEAGDLIVKGRGCAVMDVMLLLVS
jgi:hypothetical protein